MNADPRNPHPIPLAMQEPVDPDPAVQIEAKTQSVTEAHACARAIGWWNGYDIHDPKAVLAKLFKMVIELGEVALALRAGRWRAAPRPATAKETEREGVSEKIQEGAMEELADVEIRLDDFLGACVAAGLFSVEDYVNARLTKMKANRDLSRHAGKAF